MRGRISPENIDHITRPHDHWRPLLLEIREPQLLDQGERQSALAAPVMPAHGHVVERGDPATGEAPVDVILVLANARRRGEQLRLMALHPERFWDHPLGGDGPPAVAVDAQGRIAACRNLGRFSGGAHIHPDHGWAQRLALRIDRDDGAAGGVDRHCHDLVGGDAAGCQRTARRLAHGAPPVFRILLGPARVGELGLIGAGM